MRKLFLLLAIISAYQLQAQSPTAPALGYNVFLQNGMTVRTDETEGAAAMGGDLTIQGQHNFAPSHQSNFTVGGLKIGLLVGGKVNYNSGSTVQVKSGSYVKIGIQNGSKVWYTDMNNATPPVKITKDTNYGSSPAIQLEANAPTLGVSATVNPVFQSGLIDFAAAFNTMKASSTAIAGLSHNATLTTSNGYTPIPANNITGQVFIHLSPGVNVINITGTQLNTVSELNFYNGQTPNASRILVVNVTTPATFTWNTANNNWSLTEAAYVFYNFPNATTLTVQGNGAVRGTLFAPFADIIKNASGLIQGQVIGQSFVQTSNGGGEIHPAIFTSTISGTPAPVAGFTVNTSTQCLTGNSFVFTNTSTGSGLSYSWNFGDGTSSTSASPSKTYASAGSYTVTLTATSSSGSSTATATVQVNPSVTPSVTIAAAPSNSICANTPVTFTATPVNGGTTPVYQWKKNNVNVGTNSNTYTNNSLSNGDVITVTIVSNAACASSSPVSATNPVTMSVTPVVNPSVTIAASPSGSICANTPVTFTATPTNGGTSPAYVWKRNGATVGTNSNTYTNNNLSNGDVITVQMTSNAACAPATPVSPASPITMSVTPAVTPSVTIAASPSASICANTPVTFTATPVNGGAAPVYQWKKNNVDVGTNSNTYTDNSLNDNDVITVAMVSNAACASSTPVSPAAPITMTVTSNVTPSVTIAAAPSGTVCAGTPVTFTATPVNGGASPTYVWKKNGNSVGTNSNTYTDNSLADGDEVTVEMTSNANCASTAAVSPAAPITASISPVAAQPAAFTLSSATAYQGQTNVVYTVPNDPDVTYNWSYSGTGVTMTGSGNSRTLSFDINATGGTLSVTATNGCGTSAAREIAISVLPYITWTCANSNDWNDGGNWDAGFAPYGSISVLIPSTVACLPAVNGNLEVRDLVVEDGVKMEIDDNAELLVKGNAEINGEICGGYVVLAGTGPQTLSGTGKICNLELDNPDGVTITPGDTIRIVETYKPTEGELITNGGLELLSDSTGTAVILAHPGVCTTYIVGDVIVNKYFPGGRRAFRFLAHPFTHSIGLDQLTDDIDITGQDGAANGFTTTATNNPSAFWYNTLTGNGSGTNDNTGWIAFTHTNGQGANAWNPMQGARIYVRGTKGEGLGCDPCAPSPALIDMTGEVNQCDVTINLQTNANMGYNFIGNPYPSNVDMSLITRGAAVGANFSVWDPHQGVYGAYVTQPFAHSYILPAYSSFITTCSANSGNTITFHESAKTGAAPTHQLFKTTSSAFGANSVQLRILSDNESVSWDRLLLFFDNNSTTAKDAHDAAKLSNPTLDFYTIGSDAEKMAIDHRPLTASSIIPLGLRTDSQKSYVIKVEDFDIPAGTQLYLKDKFLNQTEVLSHGMTYSFSVTGNPLSQGNDRFEISIGTTGMEHTVSAAGNLSVQLSPNPAAETVMISLSGNARGASTVKIASMMGQQVFEGLIDQNGMVIVPVQHLSQGVYMVTIQNGSTIVTGRLMKQ